MPSEITKIELAALPEGWFTLGDIEVYRKLFAELPAGARAAEIGTWKGRSLLSVSDIILQKNLRVVAVDTFQDEPRKEAHVKVHEELLENIKRAGLGKNVLFKPITSVAAAAEEADNSFDFVFLDANHRYIFVLDDIRCWYPKLKANAVLGGHDYSPDWPGVIGAVKESFAPEEVTLYKNTSMWSAQKSRPQI